MGGIPAGCQHIKGNLEYPISAPEKEPHTPGGNQEMGADKRREQQNFSIPLIKQARKGS